MEDSVFDDAIDRALTFFLLLDFFDILFNRNSRRRTID